jgi:hypothetical protein
VESVRLLLCILSSRHSSARHEPDYGHPIRLQTVPEPYSDHPRHGNEVIKPQRSFIIKKYLRKDQNGYRIVRSSVYPEYFVGALAQQVYRSGAADADEPSPATKRVGISMIEFPRFL